MFIDFGEEVIVGEDFILFDGLGVLVDVCLFHVVLILVVILIVWIILVVLVIIVGIWFIVVVLLWIHERLC